VFKFRRGLEFNKGRLLEFTRYSLTAMRPWPTPLAWKRTPFRPIRPRIPLVPGPPRSMDDAEAYARDCEKLRQFMAPAPPEVQVEIGRFRSRHWHMTALFARCPGALDLVRSTPALAFALASNWVFRATPPSQPMRSARRLVRLPQTEVCGWLGLPARRATVNALRKLRVAEISVVTLLNLRDALRDEEGARLLRHLPVLCEQSVAIARRPDARRHFSPRLLAEIPAWNESLEKHTLLRSWSLFLLMDRNTWIKGFRESASRSAAGRGRAALRGLIQQCGRLRLLQSVPHEHGLGEVDCAKHRRHVGCPAHPHPAA
jgi:hypothetical protein